jgi:hypothetical protein
MLLLNNPLASPQKHIGTLPLRNIVTVQQFMHMSVPLASLFIHSCFQGSKSTTTPSLDIGSPMQGTNRTTLIPPCTGQVITVLARKRGKFRINYLPSHPELMQSFPSFLRPGLLIPRA